MQTEINIMNDVCFFKVQSILSIKSTACVKSITNKVYIFENIEQRAEILLLYVPMKKVYH